MRGYTAKVGLRKSQLRFDAIRARQVVRQVWGTGEATTWHCACYLHAESVPLKPREAATHLLDDCPCPRPCCHTTGPHHHPACQEGK